MRPDSPGRPKAWAEDNFANARQCGICGQTPSHDVEVARYLVGRDSISLTPDRVLRTMQAVLEIERVRG
jgi:pyruvate,water dikinase